MTRKMGRVESCPLGRPPLREPIVRFISHICVLGAKAGRSPGQSGASNAGAHIDGPARRLEVAGAGG